jgi:gluconolactonase
VISFGGELTVITHRLADDVGFTEGPVFMGSGDVVFTSIDRGLVYVVRGGETTTLAETGGGPNGATEGRNGLVYVAQNGGTQPAHRWPGICGGIQVITAPGEWEWLTRDTVSPNDLCFGPDGWLWVTDPTRGREERDDGRLWRCDPDTGESELLVSLPWYPNGIGFGLEADAVYVAHTRDGQIIRFPIHASNHLGPPELFVQMSHGVPDGFAFDVEGNLVVAAVGAEGETGNIQTFDREGALIDVFDPGLSRKCTNVAISHDKRLLITDADAGCVFEVADWPNAGLALHPHRACAAPTVEVGATEEGSPNGS